MRTLREICRNSAITVVFATVHGGMGAIRIGDWEGSVIWGNDEEGREHVSASPFDHSITPSWDDMCKVKDIFFDDEELVIQIYPPKSKYINLMPNCLHLWKPKDPALLKGLTF